MDLTTSLNFHQRPDLFKTTAGLFTNTTNKKEGNLIGFLWLAQHCLHILSKVATIQETGSQNFPKGVELSYLLQNDHITGYLKRRKQVRQVGLLVCTPPPPPTLTPLL